MNYKTLFYVGCVITAITLISTIVAFFKCNVIEIVCDLLGIKLQKKVSIKRIGKKKSKAVATTVKVKKKEEVKIRSRKEIEERQNTKSYYAGPRKKSTEKTGRITNSNEVKEEIEDTNMIQQENIIDETGIMEVEDTNIIDIEISMIESDETSMIEEDTGIMGDDDTCIIDDKDGIEENINLIEEEETNLLEEDETNLLEEEETSLLDDGDETSLLGIDEEEDDETCLLGDENLAVEDGFAEEFEKEFEVIVINSNTII